MATFAKDLTCRRSCLKETSEWTKPCPRDDPKEVKYWKLTSVPQSQ